MLVLFTLQFGTQLYCFGVKIEMAAHACSAQRRLRNTAIIGAG